MTACVPSPASSVSQGLSSPKDVRKRTTTTTCAHAGKIRRRDAQRLYGVGLMIDRLFSRHSAPDSGNNKREISSRETLLCSELGLRRRYASSLCPQTTRARPESRGSDGGSVFTRLASSHEDRWRISAKGFKRAPLFLRAVLRSPSRRHDPHRTTVRERMSTRESGDRGGRDISGEPGAPGISFAAWWQPCCAEDSSSSQGQEG